MDRRIKGANGPEKERTILMCKFQFNGKPDNSRYG